MCEGSWEEGGGKMGESLARGTSGRGERLDEEEKGRRDKEIERGTKGKV
jgi:hypothetical protein